VFLCGFLSLVSFVFGKDMERGAEGQKKGSAGGALR
jgi:hypothetical protein